MVIRSGSVKPAQRSCDFSRNNHQDNRMENMEKICFEIPEVFVPTETQLDILRAVADRQGCHIGDVVHSLFPTRSESSVRSGVRILLSKGCLDGGNSSREILLRLTSRGRVLIQPWDGRRGNGLS